MGDLGKLGSAERPLRVAIVGSGPAGFYAAESLMAQGALVVQVDVFDRLPTPYGLVRGGVAPDHQSIKAVSKVFAKTAGRVDCRFFGNVELGRDLLVEDLRAHYDQIIYAVGNEGDRRLGIPGEGMPRSTPAAVFVGWYNGHPDYREARFDFSKPRVAVVGNGNVAVDVLRILAKGGDELAKTDIAAHALEALQKSAIEEIVLLGRRGPVQAAFTPAELKELGKLESAIPLVDPEDLALDPISVRQLEGAPRQVQRNLEILEGFARNRPQAGKRRIVFRFFVSPVEVIAAADDGVGGLVLERNRLEEREGGLGSRAVPTGEREQLPVDMVLPAVGFAGRSIPGVPFDAAACVISNREGRVVDQGGALVPRQYVVGWARTGPQGLIGAHKKASAEVVAAMLEDAAALAAGRLPARESIVDLLAQRGARAVTFADWEQLDEVERARGARRGAPRDKLTRVEEMLEALDQSAGEEAG